MGKHKDVNKYSSQEKNKLFEFCSRSQQKSNPVMLASVIFTGRFY